MPEGTHVYEGKPDGRQGTDTAAPVSRFRPTYRALTDEEKQLHDSIKTQAQSLENLFSRVKEGRYKALALTALEESVMWVVKELTGAGMKETKPMPLYAQLEEIARKCHEANRVYCQSLGDDTQPAWETAAHWQKQSAINGVKFHLLNPDATPENSHESWMKEKLADGWKYGPVKDPEKKEHPCIVPYNGLPPAQQKKDAIFISIVNEHRESLK